MFRDKVALVTGAAMGIGKEIATQLAKEGAGIVVADLEEENGLAFADELKAAGYKALYTKVNVLDEDSVRSMVDQAMRHFGHIDILINSAGVTQGKPMEEISVKDWDFVLNVNLRGPYLCTKHILPAMKKQHYGRIVNISSIAAMMGGGFVGTSHYAASKAGIVGFTVATAKESARFGVTANVVAPGPCRTRMSAGWLEDHEESMAKTIPVQKVGEPEDMAHAILFLASDKSNFITGQHLAVDGGLTTIGPVQNVD